jgi:rhodanese-related sulfurtransferase
MSVAAYRNVDPEEAARLLSREGLRILDVRTPEEYESQGHIPGAHLLPVDLIASAPAMLPLDGKPLLVYCQHGMRSVTASRFLAAAGFPDVMNLVGGISCWRGPREHGPVVAERLIGPSAWLVQNADLLPRRGKVLDLACGRGRHALPLAAAGLDVKAVDVDAQKVEALRVSARRLGLHVKAETQDLEKGKVNLGDQAYDVIVGFHYLHRPLFPLLGKALKPGGWLLYETFTKEQAGLGGPTSPEHLLEPGELPQLVAPLEVVRKREGEFEGKFVSGVAARKARV